MKTLKTMMTAFAIVFAMNVNAQGEDVLDQLPKEIRDILTTGPTFPNVPNLPVNKSGNKTNTTEVSEYLVNFNESLTSTSVRTSNLQKQGASILKMAEKDPKFQLIKPFLSNVVSLQQLALDVASIEDQIIAMDNGAQFYTQLQYSLQIANYYSKPSFQNSKNGKGGPLAYEIEFVDDMGDCLTLVGTFIAAGASVGAGVGGVTIPVIGSVPGTVVGGVIGGIVGGIGCLFQ